MESDKIRTVNLLLNIFIFYGISLSAIDPLIPLLSEKLKIGYDKIGIILLITAVFSLISTYISGRLSDKYNIKKIILLGLLILFLGFLLFGIYLNLIIFIITLILFRLGQGILDSSVHSYTSHLYYRKHSPAFIKLDFYWYIGAIIGPSIISLFLFLKFDPKYAFLVFSFAFLVILIFFYKICPKENIRKSDPAEDNLNGENKGSFSILKKPIIIISCAAMFFYLGIFTGLSSWLTTYFTSLNIPVSYGSIILSFFWGFSALGVFIIGKLIRKNNDVTLLLFCCIIAVICTILYGFISILYLKLLFLMLQAVFYASFFPLLLSITVHEEPKYAGTISAYTISVAIAGSIIFQPLIGYFTQYIGKSSIIFIIMAAAIIEMVFISVLFRLASKKYKIRPKIIL